MHLPIAAYISGRRNDVSFASHDSGWPRRRRACARLWPGIASNRIARLADADDSDVVLIPPDLNDIEQTLRRNAPRRHG